MTEREALKLALEAFEHFYSYGYDRVMCEKAIIEIKEALAQPEQNCTRSHPHEEMSKECELRTEIARLRNKLANRTWVGLTKAQCGVLWKTNMTPFEYYQAIEDKLKEKNT